MKTVLVLGGTQFFGKRLVQRLLDEGHRVTIATRGMTQDNFGDKVERLTIDRENGESLYKAFEGKKWDIVYDQSCFSPIEAREAAEALKGKTDRYIFTSSQAVYEFGTNHKEDNFNPENFHFEYKTRREYPGYAGYQEAKRASEAVLFSMPELDTVAVRFPIVIGKDDYTDRLKFHVDLIKAGKPIGIPNPEMKFSFITSEDAAEFLMNIGQDQFIGPINPGCEGDISLMDLLAKIEAVTGNEAVIVKEKTKENASPYAMDGSWSINTEKATGLGYRFSGLNETLEDLIHYYAGLEVKAH